MLHTYIAFSGFNQSIQFILLEAHITLSMLTSTEMVNRSPDITKLSFDTREVPFLMRLGLNDLR